MIAGRYSLKDEIGRGGMGIVWRAVDESLERDVAVKRVGLMPGGASPDLARAAREARLAASLNHPNVVAVFDLVEEGDEQWLVMEYVESTTLAQLVRENGPLDPDAAAPILAQAADALAAAHGAGIVHRDVKPSNILVTPSGKVKLTDFGIARASADTTLTQTGMMTGSPAYLAPEIASGGTATPASDVWALGATVFHALTGRPPYDVDGNVMGALYQIVHEDPPRPPDAGWLTPLVEATMTKDPADRWTMEQAASFLAAGAGGGRPTSRRTMTAANGETAVLAPVTAPEATTSTRTTRPTPTTPPPATPPPTTPPPATAAPATGQPPRERRRPGARTVIALVAAVAVVVLAVLAWNWFDTDPVGTDEASGGSSGQSAAPKGNGAPDKSSEGPTVEGMQSFVSDYLATVTSDPSTTWQELTPGFQRQSGGYGGYTGFWSTIESASPDSIEADTDSMKVSYTATYQKTNGETVTDDVTLQLTMQDGKYLIAGEG